MLAPIKKPPRRTACCVRERFYIFMYHVITIVGCTLLMGVARKAALVAAVPLEARELTVCK
jgi:hypothetical protein